MDLLEYQGKQLFRKHGVPIPDGEHATSVQEAVEKASSIAEEYYAAIVFDRSAKKPMAMLSRMGGMDVEEVADRDPEAVRMRHVDPLLGFEDFHGRRLAFEAEIAGDLIRPVGAMLGRLYEVFVREDATLVEVNPPSAS